MMLQSYLSNPLSSARQPPEHHGISWHDRKALGSIVWFGLDDASSCVLFVLYQQHPSTVCSVDDAHHLVSSVFCFPFVLKSSVAAPSSSERFVLSRPARLLGDPLLIYSVMHRFESRWTLVEGLIDRMTVS